ncbi:RDD family protein [Dechloromonas sp. HYN0024]|uniref:RDD family protein n=1 Tax=Dechloromonas sp. HYN0024 TaxID=2231055 RepID=UPI000E4360BA|nr:RDD family protein [Dechloromonas sp. HYN0024]AXS79381.1 RDD family protein [Dechloromonas sp. HYN0024]
MATPLTGIRRRLICLLYEGLVVFSILLIGFLLPQIVLSGFHFELAPRMLWLHVVLLLLAYFVWCWLNGGQTLPMKTWKLRLISAEGTALRPLQAVLRYLAAWPSILLFGIGIFWALFDKDGQFLHDRIAGTRIISVSN